MQSLEAACEEAETLRSSSMLLEKLVARERLHTLILNLYPGNKGYSFARRIFTEDNIQEVTIATASAHSSENMISEHLVETTLCFPYEEETMLRYIDNEELPEILSDLLEVDCSYMYYNGCVITEVRDYRQAFPNFICDTHYVLLRPTAQSHFDDVNRIAYENDWSSNEERLVLEKELLLATRGPLCLDPSPTAAVIANRIQHERQLLNTRPLRRCARKFSQVTANRKRKLYTHTHHKGLELYDFITRHRAKTRNTLNAAKLPKKVLPIPAPSLELPSLDPPQTPICVSQFARTYNAPPRTSNCAPNVIEEYTFETDQRQGPVNHIKLTILQRPSNLEYIGELYLDRDHRKEENKGSACRFSLGSCAHAISYRKQFTEIFTEDGRKPVKITAKIANRPPRVEYTGGMKQTVTAQQSQQQAQQAAAAAVAAAANASAAMSRNTVQPGPSGTVAHLSNGTVQGTSVVLLQGAQGTIPIAAAGQNSVTSVPILQSQLQTNNQPKPLIRHSNPEINAIANNFMNSAQQFQQQAAANAAANAAAAAAKSASSSGNNAAIRSLLNSSPANHLNSAASAAVANALTNNSNAITLVGLTQAQTINQKILPRKMTFANVPNSRVINRSNQVTVTNNSVSANSVTQGQINLQALVSQLTSPSVNAQTQQQGQAFTVTSLGGSSIGYTTLPLNTVSSNKQINNHTGRLITTSASSPAGTVKRIPDGSPGTIGTDSSVSNSVGLQALLKGTASADNPIPGVASESSLLERIRASSGTSPAPSASPTQQFTVPSPKNTTQYVAQQSPKSNNPVISPMSSPPPQIAQSAAGTVHSLNLAQIANLSGLVQITGLTGHPTGVLVSVPVTSGLVTTTGNTHIVSAASVSGTGTLGSNTTAMLPITAFLTPGVKSNLRMPTGQQLQLVSTLQRPSVGTAQLATQGRQAMSPRGILNAQRTATAPLRMTAPSTAQMTATSLAGAGVNVAANSVVTLQSQPQQIQLALQKQAQLQQLQLQHLQQCLSQQQQKGAVTSATVATKHRRRSNAADPNK